MCRKTEETLRSRRMHSSTTHAEAFTHPTHEQSMRGEAGGGAASTVVLLLLLLLVLPLLVEMASAALLARRLPLRTPSAPPPTNAAGLLRRRGLSTMSEGTPRPPITFYYNDVWSVLMPQGHRFPMDKYVLFRTEAQQRLEGSNLATFLPSPLASIGDLETTHDRYYIQRYVAGKMTPPENRAIGFPWNRQHVERTLSSVGGTVAAMHSLFQPVAGVDGSTDGDRSLPMCAGHCAGGTHHAFREHGEGFCIFSDIAVAANVCLREYPDQVSRVLIVDLDVHQGNGNAVLFKDEPRVFTFSMHCRSNYFSEKQQSDLDVEVEPGADDEEYLALLAHHLPLVLARQRPDIVFYQAGVDVLASDRLGRLELTREGVRRRNAMVYEAVKAAEARLVVTAGGGYPIDSDADSKRDIIGAHADVYVQAAESFGGGGRE